MTWKKCLRPSLLLTLIILIFSCNQYNSRTGQWDIFELTLTNDKSYSDPFTGVTLTVKYTRPDGTIVEFPGFYAGENRWKIRFMPDQTGKWKFEASFSDNNSKIKGSFLCVPSDLPGPLTIYQENPVWFGTRYGKPVMLRSFHAGDRFFADTSNFITGEPWGNEQRSRFLNWLQANRYNMLSVASHYLNRNSPGRGKGWNTPDLWDENAQVPVPSEYDRMELVLNELAERRIIVFPFAGFLGRNSGYPADPEKLDLYLTYTISRLGPYWNILFNVGGPEPTLPHSPYLTKEEVIKTGTRIKELNKTGHLITVHTPTGDSEFRDESWLDFITLQGPKTKDRKALSEGLLRNHPCNKGLYAQETLWPGNKYHPAYTMEDVRKNTIVTTMAAAMINFADMNGDSSSGFSGCMNPDSANYEIHDVFHKTLDFFETIEYHKLKPHNDLTDKGFCLALPGEKYLVYLENDSVVNINTEPGKYNITWINAQNTEIKIQKGETDSGSELKIPAKETDWFLLLELK